MYIWTKKDRGKEKPSSVDHQVMKNMDPSIQIDQDSYS